MIRKPIQKVLNIGNRVVDAALLYPLRNRIDVDPGHYPHILSNTVLIGCEVIVFGLIEVRRSEHRRPYDALPNIRLRDLNRDAPLLPITDF